MNYKSVLLILFSVLVVGGIVAILYAQQETEDVEPVAPVEQTVDTAKVVGENVTFTITEADHKRWELQVKKAYYFPDKSGADLDGVQGQLYNDEGKVTATFTSPKGMFNQAIKSLRLTGGVVVDGQNDEAVQLTAPQLEWSPKNQNIFAEGGVRIIRQGFGESTASTCHFTMDFSSIELEGNAQTKLDL